MRPTAAAVRRGFRPDVQGLRAVAVGSVVLYHLYPTVVPGGYVGVDVFFAISGYLITGHLLRSLQRTGRVSLLDFYGRRARRLLPAATLVLAVTWVAARLVLPSTQLTDTATQVRASALYVQNWVLARNAVSYLKSDDAPSPVQHFWSLSVEEQFYLVWPLLFVLAAVIARLVQRRSGRPADSGALVLGLASVLTAASLAWSVAETRSDPAAAYFVTPTRMWELGLGGLLAVLVARAPGRRTARHRPAPRPLPRPRRARRRAALGWAGLALIVACDVVLHPDTAFPGWIALLPVGGAVSVLGAGARSSGSAGVDRVLRWAPLVFLGDISYSLYLWHWPLIVCWRARSQHAVGLTDGAVLIIVSIVLAWLSTRYVENRVRRAGFFRGHPWRSLATALTAAVPVLLVTVWLVRQPGAYTPLLHDRLHPGAAALAGTVTHVPVEAAVPTPAVAELDTQVASSKNCETPPLTVTPELCTFGRTKNPRLTVALVGDSFAGQWSSALADIATRRGWKLVTVTHSACPWTAAIVTRPGAHYGYRECHAWGVQAADELVHRIRPDVVVTSDRPTTATPAHPSGSTPATRAATGAGMATYFRQLLTHGIAVVGIRESPVPGFDIPTCLAQHDTAAPCAVPAATAVYQHTALQAAVRAAPAVSLIDLNPLICTASTCPAVVGNVVVYRDDHHLSRTYTVTMEPYLERKLLATGAFATG